MPLDKTIFGLCFWSDETLYPTLEDLRAFLESPKKKGVRARHKDDLATYHELLERVTMFESHQHQGASLPNFRDRMLYRVLILTHFANPVLKREVELYKYHVKGLSILDFNKPAAFIDAAEEEIRRLRPRREKASVKLSRLRSLIKDRNRSLEILEKRRMALAQELCSIMKYIRSNLLKIGKLCEASIVILMELQSAGKIEGRVIEEIKADYKEKLTDVLHQGQVDRKYLKTAKQDVDKLTREMSALIREDLYAMAGLYEAIYDHTKRTVHDLDIWLAETESRKYRSFKEDCELFTQVEQVLVSLISDYRFELKSKSVRSVPSHEKILMEKRHEVIEDVFAMLSCERRVRADRRSHEQRRRYDEPGYTTRDRRQGTDRRLRDRREPISLGAYL